MKKLLLALLLFATPAAAQTTLPLGQTGGSGGSIQVRDSAGNWITVGSINNTSHTASFLPSFAANQVMANFTAGAAAPVGFTMPACAAPSFLGYTNGTGIVCNAIGNNNVTLTNLAQIAANTMLGNWTGSTANVTANTMPACAAPNVLEYTNGTGVVCSTVPAPQLATVATGHRLTGVSGFPIPNNGSGLPVGVSTIFYTPYLSDAAILSVGGADSLVHCAETSNVLANSSVGNAGPAAAVANSVYDMFLWSNAGVCTLTRGPVWTNNTTRSAGTALARTNGILRNSVAITNGPGANAGTYVGTIMTDTGTATVTQNYNGTVAPAIYNIWNMYNRVNTAIHVAFATTNYTYASGTIREAGGVTTNQVNFVIGQGEEGYPAWAQSTWQGSAATTTYSIGIGCNATTGGGSGLTLSSAMVAAQNTSVTSSYSCPDVPFSVGAYFIARVESGGTTPTINVQGTDYLNVILRQ